MSASQQRKDRVKAALSATRERRKSQTCRVILLKVDASKLNRGQAEALDGIFREAKWLWNDIIAKDDIFHYTPGKTALVRCKDDKGHWTVEEREFRFLSAQECQSVAEEPKRAAIANKRKKEKAIERGEKPPKTGPIGYRKTADEIPLKQAGVTYRFTGPSTVHVQGIPGDLHLTGLRQMDFDAYTGSTLPKADTEVMARLDSILGIDWMDYEMADAKLIRRPSGYYLAITTYEDEIQCKARRIARAAITGRRQTGYELGGDAGQSHELTLSDGTTVDNREYESKRLKVASRHMAKRKRFSKGWWRAKHVLDREYERIAALKDAKADETVNDLYWRTHRLYVQDEQIALWKKRKARAHGSNVIHHGTLGRMYAKFRHSPDWVTVCDKWQPTTAWCPHCGRRTKHPPGVETYRCQWCGYTAPRDVHAAGNMIPLGKFPVTLEQLRMDRSTPIGPYGTRPTANRTVPTVNQ